MQKSKTRDSKTDGTCKVTVLLNHRHMSSHLETTFDENSKSMFPIAHMHGENSLKFACFKTEMLTFRSYIFKYSVFALLKIFHFMISTKPSDELFRFFNEIFSGSVYFRNCQV